MGKYSTPRNSGPSPDKNEKPIKTGSSVKKNNKIMLISLCSVAAVLLIGIIVSIVFLIATDPNDGKILNNVSIAGVNVGNMSRSEAKAAVRAAT